MPTPIQKDQICSDSQYVLIREIKESYSPVPSRSHQADRGQELNQALRAPARGADVAKEDLRRQLLREITCTSSKIFHLYACKRQLKIYIHIYIGIGEWIRAFVDAERKMQIQSIHTASSITRASHANASSAICMCACALQFRTL